MMFFFIMTPQIQLYHQVKDSKKKLKFLENKIPTKKKHKKKKIQKVKLFGYLISGFKIFQNF